MDFFNKAKKALKEVLDDDKKDVHKEDHKPTEAHHIAPGEAHRGASDSYFQGQQQQNQAGPGPPHSYGPPSGEPQLPPGWIKQWDQNSQKWYYVEQATGRTQWEPPSFSPPPPGQYGHDQSRGAFSPGGAPGYPPQGHGYPGQGYPPQGYPGYGAPGYPPHGDGEHSKAKKGMNPMMAGVAGAAVGAAGGAWIAHEMTEDSQGNAVASTTYAAPAGAAPGMYGTPGSVPPPPLEADPNLDSSDRESVGEAADDVRDAQQEYNDAVASGSESDVEEAREDLAEANEEYHSEVEEAYED